MAAGFGGVRPYAGWIDFIYKIKLKLSVEIVLGQGGWRGYEKRCSDVFCFIIDL